MRWLWAFGALGSVVFFGSAMGAVIIVFMERGWPLWVAIPLAGIACVVGAAGELYCIDRSIDA